jgi:deoxyribodipyrimidine photolyase-related protein
LQLRFILGDQLNTVISSLADADKAHDIVMLCEVLEEATYVKHHQKKLVYVFSAMRHFASELREAGFNVHYVQLDDVENSGSFTGELSRAVQQFKPEKVIVTEASEYRVLQAMKSWQTLLSIPVEICPDKRFLCSHKGFAEWANGRQQWRMEYFYREVRKTYGILMDGDAPMGGEWNYDAQNRKPPPADLTIPATYQEPPDSITLSVIKLVGERFSHHFGTLDGFCYAVTRRQALDALKQFIDTRLVLFGDYQDAMVQDEPWLFHSHIGLYLNNGLLLPIECIQFAEQAYHQKKAPLNAVEGFIRQIAGWREYVRGVYWLNMPDYVNANALDAQRPLPDLYWTANTHMNCMKQCVQATQQHAYAHHIQRLMVLGNFALLASLNPQAVNEWYLLVYADAYEWVELPNVSGMVLYADNGQLASKPYAAGGAYIDKMSNYCKSCHYKLHIKNGEAACPFNYLYWDFLIRHQSRLAKNPRLAMIYSTLNKMDAIKKESIQQESERFLTRMDSGEKV